MSSNPDWLEIVYVGFDESEINVRSYDKHRDLDTMDEWQEDNSDV